eukprot:3126483-Lingulodinium_polyedra.AAC.1
MTCALHDDNRHAGISTATNASEPSHLSPMCWIFQHRYLKARWSIGPCARISCRAIYPSRAGA